MKPFIDVLIPTWNNPQFLIPCVESMLKTGNVGSYLNIILINNGKQPIKDQMGHIKGITIVEPGRNLGWEGGLEFGLKYSEAPFLCFQNDDVHLPRSSALFYEKLMIPFNDPKVGAVGPVSTTVAGMQSIFNSQTPYSPKETTFLIGFCMMVRRSALEEVGGIDSTLPGGDDLDLSIRLRNAGYKLIVNPEAFIIHHGFKTGEKLRGTSDKVGGWNSKEMTEKTNHALIKKHGFKTFLNTVRGTISSVWAPVPDVEGDTIRDYVKEGVVYEMGVGSNKTIPESIGIDRIAKGEMIPSRSASESVADIVCDVQGNIPLESNSADFIIARQVLEHCIDLVKTLMEWNRLLKMGGELIVSVPNQNVINGIPLNSEHVHGFTPESLNHILELCGFEEEGVKDPKNGISFIGFYKKVAEIENEEKSELVLTNGHQTV